MVKYKQFVHMDTLIHSGINLAKKISSDDQCGSSMVGNPVTFVYIVKAKNGLHAYSFFVDNTLGVCNEHEGSSGRGVQRRRRISMGDG